MSNEQQTTPGTEQPVEETNAAEPITQADTDEVSDAEVQSPDAQIEALQEQLLKTKDEALRTLADAQNIKRRAEQDIDKARKFALEKFAGELLAVVDNLERTMEATDRADEAVKPLLEGVELTQKLLLDTLNKFNIVQLNPLGEPFDPQFHQAMSIVENPDIEPNSVTLVMQKGYTINERLLRPAMVMVSKAPSAAVDEKA